MTGVVGEVERPMEEARKQLTKHQGCRRTCIPSHSSTHRHTLEVEEEAAVGAFGLYFTSPFPQL